MSKPIELEICVVEKEFPFICGVWGEATIDILKDIEKELEQDPIDYPKEAITIRVRAIAIPDEEDCIGGITRVINRGYWDLTLLSSDCGVAQQSESPGC